MFISLFMLRTINIIMRKLYNFHMDFKIIEYVITTQLKNKNTKDIEI